MEQGLPTQPAVAMTSVPLPPPVATPTMATFTPAKSRLTICIHPANKYIRRGRENATLGTTLNIRVTGNCHPSPAVSSPEVPYTTMRNRKRKLEKQSDGTVFRKYIRKSAGIICGKCGKERTQERHKQHYGNWFCADTATQQYEDWLASVMAKGYGKKTKKITLLPA